MDNSLQKNMALQVIYIKVQETSLTLSWFKASNYAIKGSFNYYIYKNWRPKESNKCITNANISNQEGGDSYQSFHQSTCLT